MPGNDPARAAVATVMADAKRVADLQAQPFEAARGADAEHGASSIAEKSAHSPQAAQSMKTRMLRMEASVASFSQTVEQLSNAAINTIWYSRLVQRQHPGRC